jgi:hypothetical protein
MGGHRLKEMGKCEEKRLMGFKANREMIAKQRSFQTNRGNAEGRRHRINKAFSALPSFRVSAMKSL